MIAADTSSLVAYFAGGAGRDVNAVDAALRSWQLALPPVVLTEMLSDPRASTALAPSLLQLPLLSTHAGYWQRAGALRAKVLSRRLKSRVADALIAQSCLDHGVPLVTRDHDFRHYVRLAGLKLV